MNQSMPDFDVIIVGSGPAGVSVAFPLVQAGLKVLMVDGGHDSNVSAPDMPYLASRQTDKNQSDWMLGKDFHALRFAAAPSPKLRAPTHSYVFDSFEKLNNIEGDNFVTTGSLASGGLSNAWGCGVARLSLQELKAFPFSSGEIEASYAAVANRIGISGKNDDDLSDYFRLDEYADQPISMDALQTKMLARYQSKASKFHALGIKFGRSRVAVLSADRKDRQACDLSGNCLWGCHRKSLYSSRSDLSTLKKFTNFHYRPGFLVENVFLHNHRPTVQGRSLSNLLGGNATLSAHKVMLAAGTLATSRLSMIALKLNRLLTMQSTPVAAFMLWLPTMLGTPRTASFGLGQLSFALSLNHGISGFGSLFNTTGIPISEFSKYMPLNKPLGIQVLKSLLSSCVVGNIYLPGSFTDVSLQLDQNKVLKVSGKYKTEVSRLMDDAKNLLRRSFMRLGALMLPGSFTLSKPGGDIHHACSLPMRENPTLGETDRNGELFGLAGVHIVDGASLSALSEKSHTLTIMANADRIGRLVAEDMVLGKN